MLKDVHGGHEIKGLTWESAAFEIDVCCWQPTPVQTPLAEAEQRRANVCQGDVEPMAGEEDATRAYPGAKVQVAPAPMLPGKVQSRDVGQRGGIIAQRVPPHQFVDSRLTHIVKLFDRLAIIRVHLRLPLTLECGHCLHALALDLGHVWTAHVRAQFGEQTL